MNPLHNHPYDYSGFTSQDANDAPPGQAGQEPAAGGPPWPAPPRVLPNQALPGLSGYGAGPQHAQQAGTRTPPVAATVNWPMSVSYPPVLPSTSTAMDPLHNRYAYSGFMSQDATDAPPAGQAGQEPAAGGLPCPPPHLVLRSQALSELRGDKAGTQQAQEARTRTPPVAAEVSWPAQAGPRAVQKNKRPAPEETAPDGTQPKRLLRTRPGAEVAAAAARPSEPAWPETWPTTSKIACPENVLKSLCIGGRSTRQLQFKHYDLKAGVVSIRAVAQACSKVNGTLVTEHDGKGVYAFDNVVLTAKTKITQSDKLVEDQPIGTVYLELGKAEDGTTTLSDLHLLIPEAVSATPQTSGPVYSNDEAAILEYMLEYMRSKNKGKKAWEVRQLGEQHKAEQPAPSRPFRPGKVFDNYWRDHKSFFMTLGCKYSYHVNDLLLECEGAMGGPPGDGEHLLTLMRGKQEHRLLWVVEGGYTTHLIDARDEKEAQQELTRRRSRATKIQAAQLAKSGVMPRTLSDEVRRIVERREKELKALAWGNDLKSVVRDLSARCEMARFDSKYDSIKSCPEDEEVMEFHLQPPPNSGGKPARGLRWVREGKLIEIRLFNKDEERETAIEKMAEFKKESNAKREGIAKSKKNAAARAGGADG